MAPWVLFVIVAVCIVDVAVFLFVLRRMRVSAAALGASEAERRELRDAAYELVRGYLATGISGDAEQLRAALAGVVPQLQELMRVRGLTPTPGAVRILLAAALAKQGIPARHAARIPIAVA